MKIIKVDATNSTNTLARKINRQNNANDFCLTTEYQSQGRGHLGSSWQSDKSKNLLFTIVFNNLELEIEKHFALNTLVCLSLYHVLKSYQLSHLRIKWPNDILAGSYKISGILIENSVMHNTINTTYIGVGINVNQSEFKKLPQATSFLKLTNKKISRDVLLHKIISEFQKIPQALKDNSVQNVVDVYQNHLYGFNKESKFHYPDGSYVVGTIKKVNLDGRICIEFSDGDYKCFAHKEIMQIY